MTTMTTTALTTTTAMTTEILSALGMMLGLTIAGASGYGVLRS
jgi:hypothetical protein